MTASIIFNIIYIYLLCINSSDAGEQIFWLCWVNTMPADALAPKVTRATVGFKDYIPCTRGSE